MENVNHLSFFQLFFYRKSEKSASIVRDDSFTNIVHYSDGSTANKRLASAPPENNLITSSTTSQRRSRFDDNTNSSHEHLPSAISSPNDSVISDVMSNSVTATTNGSGMGSSKNRFFSLSRRFRFRVQSPDKGTSTPPPPATVHFLDEDIDLETKERTTRKSDHGNRPSKGILKTLRHRSPFRFRSKDAIIPEQEPSPPPQPTPVPSSSSPPPSVPPPASSASKENRPKLPPPAPTSAQTKQRGRLVELKKPIPKTSNNTSRKSSNTTPSTESTGSTLVRRPSGLKDLIHKFDSTTSDRPPKPKRVTVDSDSSNVPSNESSQNEQIKKSTSFSDLQPDNQQRGPPLMSTNKSKTIDIPDLLQNVQKEPKTVTPIPLQPIITITKPLLRHSSSSRQTASFDSATSMVSASESITTTNSIRRPTSTARPLMINLVS